MTHAPPLRRCESGYVTDHWLGHVLLDPLRGLGFLRPADLADHEHRLRFRILLEQLEVIEEGAAIDGVTADSHAGRLTDTQGIHLRRGFVAEGPRTRHDTDWTALVDVSGHDSQHRLAGADDAG